MTRWLGALLICGMALAGAARAEDPPPEPDGYRTETLRAPTPATLGGARVLDLAALERVVAEAPVLIDVGPAPGMVRCVGSHTASSARSGGLTGAGPTSIRSGRSATAASSAARSSTRAPARVAGVAARSAPVR